MMTLHIYYLITKKTTNKKVNTRLVTFSYEEEDLR